MAISRKPLFSALLLALVGGTLAGVAQAGEVYKCTDGNSTIYQDLPCPNHPEQGPQQRFPSSFEGADTTVAPVGKPAPPLVDPNVRQRSELYNSLHQAEEDHNRIEQGYQADVAAARARSKGNDMAADSEIADINKRWNAQLQELQQRQSALAAQAQQLCPGSKAVTRDGKCQ